MMHHRLRIAERTTGFHQVDIATWYCRSLSKSSSIHLVYNTEHDAPYWRGPIWFNINFLALRALHRYSHLPGPHASLAYQLHTQLRSNLLTNVVGLLFVEYFLVPICEAFHMHSVVKSRTIVVDR